MSTIFRPESKVQSDKSRRCTPVRGRRPAISNAGKRKTATANVNAAPAMILSGVRTCGLVVASVSRSMARRPAAAKRRASLDSTHAAANVMTRATRSALASTGSANNRPHMSAGHVIADTGRRAISCPAGLRRCRVREVVGAELCEGVQRETKAGAAALSIRSVFEYEASSMRFRNLPAQYQSDARPPGLGCEERHEQIAGI